MKADINFETKKNSAWGICAHCQNIILANDPVIYDLEMSQHGKLAFCCNGCRTVYRAILACNLDEYYKIRDNLPSLPAADEEQIGIFEYLDAQEVRHKFTNIENPDQMLFYISGIHCAACIWILEKIPELSQDVLSIRIDGMRKLALVKIAQGGKFARFAELAQKFGYQVHPLLAGEQDNKSINEERRKELKRIGITAVAAGNIMLLATSSYLGADANFTRFFNWLSLALMIPVLAIGAQPIFKQSISAVKARVPSLDLPLAIAIIAGFFLSIYHLIHGSDRVYFDTLSVLVFLILSSRFFVARLQEKFSDAKSSAINIFPVATRVWENSKINLVSAEELKSGQVVVVKSGEKIPCDGEVIVGAGWVNEAILSGESLPRLITKGSAVYAGTILESDEIKIKVDKNISSSRMGKLLINATSTALLKGKIPQQLERWAQNFTWIVLVVASCIFFYFLQIGFSIALDRTLSLLIVACPCAIAFGAPLVFSQALSKAAQQGIFFRSADIFERVQNAKTVIFDKTGTLTYGLLELIPESDSLPLEVAHAITAIESKTAHPVARAIVQKFSGRSTILPEVESFSVLPGRGIIGKVNGISYEILSSVFPNDKRNKDACCIIWVDVRWEGKSARLGFSDTIREDAFALIKNIQAKGLQTILLSGDRKENVQYIGEKLGFKDSEIFFEKDPNEKQEITKKFSKPVMVGDGMNDIGAMAVADIAIIMGGAMEKALRVADIFLTRNSIELALVPWSLSDRIFSTLRKIRFFSIAYNIFTASLAIFGFITPLAAALLMPVSSVLVLLIAVFGMRGKIWA